MDRSRNDYISDTSQVKHFGDNVRGVRLRSFGQGRESRYTGCILNMELPGRSKGGQTDGMTEDDISDRMRWS